MESSSNWLGFVNYARNEDEQNLIAFQYHGKVYYRSFKRIYPGSELLVWYGEQYAKELGTTCISAHPQVFVCHKCNDSFSELHQLQQHIRNHISNDYKNNSRKATTGSNVCNYCGKIVSSKFYLKTHLYTHTGEKPYKCQHCNKRFSLSGHLQRHLRTHTGERPYKCNHCDKRFGQRDHLQTHLRTHTGEKPYKCKHCDMRFSHSGSLKYHVNKYHQ